LQLLLSMSRHVAVVIARAARARRRTGGVIVDAAGNGVGMVVLTVAGRIVTSLVVVRDLLVAVRDCGRRLHTRKCRR